MLKDVMRIKSVTLKPLNRQALEEIKSSGNYLYQQLEDLGTSRELSIAKTKLQEAIMWASYHITSPENQVNSKKSPRDVGSK